MTDEIVVAAACKRGEKVWRGKRHNEIIVQMVNEGQSTPILMTEQGFLLSSGRFVDRYEAAQIAYVAGQTKTLKSSLTSEDLW